MQPQLSPHQSGFTLIELMVVIVIISIMASLVVMNLSGVDRRKAMQAREVLMMELKRINREANDQARIYALVTQPATDVSPFKYSIQEYNQINPDAMKAGTSNQLNALSRNANNQKKWVELKDQSNELPYAVSFTVKADQHEFKSANNSDLLGANAPKLIWLGNGEAKPVRIQMYYQQKPIGDLIQVDYLGKVTGEHQ